LQLKVESFDEVARAARSGALALIGHKNALLRCLHDESLPDSVRQPLAIVLEKLSAEETGSLTCFWRADEKGSALLPVWVGLVPTTASRHDVPARPDVVEALVTRVAEAHQELTDVPGLHLLVPATTPDSARIGALAAARALPAYERRTSLPERQVRLGVGVDAPAAREQVDVGRLRTVVGAVRQAAAWHDAPAGDLNVDDFVAEAEALAAQVGARCRILRATELEAQGYGGLVGVGRAATQEPALVVLSHEASSASRATNARHAWVGKGIVYDSGGLSLKSMKEMRGMKGDMAGAAAVLAAFAAAVRLGAPGPLHAVLCLAENAIGPRALRVDDVIRTYSGKTVEICNTDAEGRLVLADGVAHAARNLGASVIVNLATLTDAAVLATGRRHAAIVSNDGTLQSSAIQAGRQLGELVHPLPYLPELLRAELSSSLADLRNVGGDFMNANACVAAQFVAEHLSNFRGSWLHVDLEGPSRLPSGRGSGFGVGLLLGLLGVRL
jgi:probable aminopeptidase NPEPL1